MRTSPARTFKKLLMLIAAAAVFGLGEGTARADVVSISGSAQGSIGCLLRPCPANSIFNPMSFSGQTTPDGNMTLQLGTIVVADPPESFDGNQLLVTVTFTEPERIGGLTVPFTWTFAGTFSLAEDLNGNTALSLFFGDPVLLLFGNGGSFTFGLDNIENVLNSSTTTIIKGHISNATLPVVLETPIPEPATVLLLATGLAGAAGAARRRRRGPR